MPDAPLDLGFSPCPNDTFVFHALVHGDVAPELRWRVRLDDVEALNRLAERRELHVAKVSYHAFGHLADDWWMLPAGGALGHGVGPLVVTREPRGDLRGLAVATPGGRTTADLLLGLWEPSDVHRVEMRYDRIMPAVAAGEVDAGLIIHESRFTYRSHGLHEHVDLGAWWQEVSGRPIPLGGIAVRRDLPPSLVAKVADAVAASVRAARDHPERSASYVERHAQEMSAEVRRRHIELYVNDYSEDLGSDGREAVRALYRQAEERGLLPPVRDDLFWDAGARAGRAVGAVETGRAGR